MREKCTKLPGARLEVCDNAQRALHEGLVQQQTLRELGTKKVRDVLALTNGKVRMSLAYCPWCRANIETRPVERAPASRSTHA